MHVPAGEFLMGSGGTQIDQAVVLCKQFYGDGADCLRDRYTDEAPQHTVRLDEYWIMQTEVTNAQNRRFYHAAGGYTNRDYWSADGWQWRTNNHISRPGYWDEGDLSALNQPVVGVSWYRSGGLSALVESESGLSLRLPTEAEWEKAARETDGRAFPWGNNWDVTQENLRLNYCDQNCSNSWKDEIVDDGFAQTAPVGSFPAGASPYSSELDMAGKRVGVGYRLVRCRVLSELTDRESSRACFSGNIMWLVVAHGTMTHMTFVRPPAAGSSSTGATSLGFGWCGGRPPA